MLTLYKNIECSPEPYYLGKRKEPEKPDISIKSLLTLMPLIQEKAFLEGFEQGLASEKEKILEDKAAWNQDFEKLLKGIPKAIEENRSALASEIADIVFLVIKQIFLDKIEDPKTIENQINHILATLNAEHQVELCLNPADLALLQEGKIELEAMHLQSLKITAQDSIPAGNCLIKTNHGFFDLGLEKQIENFKQIILQIKGNLSHASLV